MFLAHCWSIRPLHPLTNPELRRAMGLAFDRQALLDILNEGKRSDRRQHDAAAERDLGHATRSLADTARLRLGCRKEPRRGAQGLYRRRSTIEKRSRGSRPD